MFFLLFDTHMHCDYSCDSHMQFADAIAAAEAEKIGMIVTSIGIMIILLIVIPLCLI